MLQPPSQLPQPQVDIKIPQPRVLQIQATREDLPELYRQILGQNPLLGRIQGECRTIGWNDEEIRTIQLLAACSSNASLTARVTELESQIKLLCESRAGHDLHRSFRDRG